MTRRVIMQGGTRNGATYRPYRPTTLHSPSTTEGFMRGFAVGLMLLAIAALMIGLAS